MFNSIVSLPTSQYHLLDPQTIKDLNLSEAFSQLIELSEDGQNLIYNLCQDEATILYRQGLMKDFMDQPKLLDELSLALQAFETFRRQFESGVDKASRLYYLIELVNVVEASVKCLEDLHQTLCYYKIKARGLKELKASVEEMMASSSYKKMKSDLKEIRYVFRQIKSVELSINMSSGMRPYEAQVTLVNEHPYKYPKAFRKVSDILEHTENFLNKPLKNYVAVFSVPKLDLDLLDEVEYALKSHKNILKKFLMDYHKIDALPFLKLHEEVTFYEAAYALIKPLIDSELPLCWPKPIESSLYNLDLKGAYNIFLGQSLLEEKRSGELVLNEVVMGEEGRLIILTGANRGGKTTITQMIGQLQLLMQLGLPVTASWASMTIVDQVLTLFPKLEKESVDYGRFGKECMAFAATYPLLSTKSLMLMNESFSGTSHLESLEIAMEVIRALKHKGVATVFNTHLHELGLEVEAFNQKQANECVAKSYVVGDVTSDAIYKFYESPPKGYSQAMEIAKSFGVTYSQLTEKLGGM